MEILINEDWLRTLHEILTIIYRDSHDPISSGLPLVHNYNESLISVCVASYQRKVFGKTVYPHILQRATVLLHSIITYHPFVDGNKRSALLATSFYLYWNGYDFNIPDDADVFTISVAKKEKSLNEILNWLQKNSKRTPLSIIHHWLCEGAEYKNNEIPAKAKIRDLPYAFMSRHGIRFFFKKRAQ